MISLQEVGTEREDRISEKEGLSVCLSVSLSMCLSAGTTGRTEKKTEK